MKDLMAIVLRVVDFSDWLESNPIRRAKFFLSSMLFSISVVSCETVSIKSSSFPLVGRYAVYASIFKLCLSVILYLTPQNLSEIIGIFVILDEIELCHPMAVPCHVGPLVRIRSSTGRNMSEDVV